MKKQSRLSLETISVEGNDIVFEGNKGLVKIDIDSALLSSNYISVDAFQGSGNDYRRRERCEIVVKSKGEDIFIGSFEELVERLSR